MHFSEIIKCNPAQMATFFKYPITTHPFCSLFWLGALWVGNGFRLIVVAMMADPSVTELFTYSGESSAFQYQ